MQANTLPGTSLAKSDEIGRRVEEILLSQPEVIATARRTGRAEYDEHVQGVEAAEIDVGLKETDRPRESCSCGAAATIRHAARDERDHRSADIASDRPHVVRHAGEHRRQGIRRRPRHASPARRTRSRASVACPGVVDLSLEQQMDVPFVRFVLNRSVIARHGLRPDEVAEAIETSLAGATVGRIFDRGAAFDLIVKFDPATGIGVRTHRRSADRHADRRHRADPGAGRGPPRRGTEHGAARKRSAPHRHLLQRRWPRSRQRRERHQAGGLSRPCRCRPAIALNTAGSSKANRVRRERLLALGVLAIAGVFMLLVLAFGRARDALIVMVNLPLALIGGVVGVFLSGGVLNVATMIGFITLFGIATRNGIMLVTHIHHLMNVEGVRDFREAVERGAKERLVPILMTAVAAGLALIPLALRGGQTGSEIQTPMAIVILCGLTTSTLLNMFVVPTLYLKFGSVPDETTAS